MNINALTTATIAMLVLSQPEALCQVFSIPAAPKTSLIPQRPKWTARYNQAEENDLGLWPQSMFNYRHKKFLLELDVNPRLQYNITRLNEFHLRTFAGYRVKPWLTLWIGAYPWVPVFEPTYINEARLLQQISLEKGVGRFAFSMRNRLEERFLSHTNNRTSWRIRTMPRLNYFIDEKESLYVFTADELFVNLNTISTGIRSGIGQNRLYAGAGIKLHKHARLEVAYLNQWLHRRYHNTTLPNRFNHNIVINLVTDF